MRSRDPGSRRSTWSIIARSGAMPVPPATNSSRCARRVLWKQERAEGTFDIDRRCLASSSRRCGPSVPSASSAISSSSVRVSAAVSGEHAMEYGRRELRPGAPISTAWPGLNSNGCSRRSSVTRRERGVAGATLISGTVTVGTKAKFTRCDAEWHPKGRPTTPRLKAEATDRLMSDGRDLVIGGRGHFRRAASSCRCASRLRALLS